MRFTGGQLEAIIQSASLWSQKVTEVRLLGVAFSIFVFSAEYFHFFMTIPPSQRPNALTTIP